MLRASFERELQQLRERLLALGSEVETNMVEAIELLVRRDAAGAQRLIDGDEQVKYTVGECSAGTEVSYSISGVAKGTYYVYALVRLVSDSDSEPEDGDLYGVYGGSLSDPPSAPNVSVPSSGTVTVNVTMDTFHVGR